MPSKKPSPPTTLSVTPERIAERAYELFLERGGHAGYHVEDWLQAERELLEQLEFGSASIDVIDVVEIIRVVDDEPAKPVRKRAAADGAAPAKPAAPKAAAKKAAPKPKA